MEENDMKIKAKELRPTEQGRSPKLLEIETRPGYYKWWAKKSELNDLLKGLGETFSNVKDDIEKEDDLYCIYVGIARTSLRQRLNWHVNDKHTKKRVENGFLSTLRKSLSSVIAKDQYDKDKTNDFIDKLVVEFFYTGYKTKSEESTKKLLSIEKNLIGKNLRILNIMENNHPKAAKIKKRLQELRKEAKK